MPGHTCLWIDHFTAKVFDLANAQTTGPVVITAARPHHIHRKADHIGMGREAPSPQFMREVAHALGPGTAKTEFASYLRDEHPSLSKLVWAVRPMDHPTDAEIVAEATKYFHTAIRMHS